MSQRGNATPLGLAQLRALVAVGARELGWILPSVAEEVRGWRCRAAAIPDVRLRADALANLSGARLNAEGAALFAVLPRRRDGPLLRSLVAYQTALDYLDTLSERRAPDRHANGVQLHRALVEALEPGGQVSEYYRYHPWGNDGGYLRELVNVCRLGCAGLPSYDRVRGRAVESARRMMVQSLNHDPVPCRRDAALAAWAERRFPLNGEAAWFEWTAASCSSLPTFALLALAADPELDEDDVAEAESVYFPWVCAASTLLDAFVDQISDRAEGSHSYVAHYASPKEMVERLVEIVFRSVDGARKLRNGERYALIAAGMVAMYLSKASARSCELRAATREILAAAGSLPKVQLPIMRAMRALQRLGDA